MSARDNRDIVGGEPDGLAAAGLAPLIEVTMTIQQWADTCAVLRFALIATEQRGLDLAGRHARAARARILMQLPELADS